MTDKWALITGASKRIGKAIAQELHSKNFNILIHYHESNIDAANLADQLNQHRKNSAYLIQADLNNEMDIEHIINQTAKLTTSLDVLVNNASVFNPTPLAKIDFTQCQQILTTNLIAPLLLAKGLAPMLQTQQGCVINLLDIHGQRPLKNHTLYSISKAALEMATLSLTQELAPEIRVNGVAPGAILWPEDSNAQAQAQILKVVPLGKLGRVEDIAQLVSYLVNAPYISGQVIAVDGGRSATGFKGA